MTSRNTRNPQLTSQNTRHHKIDFPKHEKKTRSLEPETLTRNRSPKTVGKQRGTHTAISDVAVVVAVPRGGLPKRTRQRETLAGPSETATGGNERTANQQHSHEPPPGRPTTDRTKHFKTKGNHNKNGAKTNGRNKKQRKSKLKQGPRALNQERKQRHNRNKKHRKPMGNPSNEARPTTKENPRWKPEPGTTKHKQANQKLETTHQQKPRKH